MTNFEFSFLHGNIFTNWNTTRFTLCVNILCGFAKSFQLALFFVNVYQFVSLSLCKLTEKFRKLYLKRKRRAPPCSNLFFETPRKKVKPPKLQGVKTRPTKRVKLQTPNATLYLEKNVADWVDSEQGSFHRETVTIKNRTCTLSEIWLCKIPLDWNFDLDVCYDYFLAFSLLPRWASF